MQEVRKKIVLIGSVGVGKTSLIKRFVTQTFSDKYLSTIGVRVDKKTIDVSGTQVQLVVWDLAGEIMSTLLLNNYVKGSSGVIGIFDLTRPSSYDEMIECMDRVKGLLPNAVYAKLGNKSDLKEKYNVMDYDLDYATSAKSGEYVDETFYEMAQKLIKVN